MNTTRLMDTGHSWSGHERNNCYVNLGNGRFVDTSAISGLDFADDGRSVVATDWDDDGDLDLWLANRTGPQIRFMRNTSNESNRNVHYVAFKLEGGTVNRDAIGARVTVRGANRQWMKELTAGGGYLSQSTKWLHFGLGDVDPIEGVTVRWPGGDVQNLPAPPIDNRYVLRQGGTPEPLPRRTGVKFSPGSLTPSAPAPSSTAVLRMPLPLSPTLRNLCQIEQSEPDVATLVLPWASWCAPCLDELTTFARQADKLRGSGVRMIALNVDKPENRATARRQFEEIFEKGDRLPSSPPRFASPDELAALQSVVDHILGKRTESLPLPAGLLIDGRGDIQVLYVGRLSVGELLIDVRRVCLESPKLHVRAYWPGRWYFRTPRDWAGLAQSLEAVGLEADAQFYARRAVAGRLKRTNAEDRGSR